MREIRSYGSVRGATRESRPYRDQSESVSLRLPDDTSPVRVLQGMTSVSEQND